MADIALVASIFGVPIAVLLLMFWINRRARRIESELELNKWPVSRPAIEDRIAEEGGLTLSRRSDVDEALIAVDKSGQYGGR